MLSEPRDIGRAVGDGNAEWFATVGASGRGKLLNSHGEALGCRGRELATDRLLVVTDVVRAAVKGYPVVTVLDRRNPVVVGRIGLVSGRVVAGPGGKPARRDDSGR